jgi:hypothetical protein
MSGPIVRKYGFPNFDKIFGERPLEHGSDDEDASGEPAETANPSESITKISAKKQSSKPKKE